MPSTFQIFAPALQKLGFQKVWQSRSGGTRIDERARKEDHRRTVTVQLWSDGAHRASHDHDGCSDTHPTDFETIEELSVAVQHESTRTDSEYRPGGTKGSWNRQT